MTKPDIEKILPHVQRPTRYIDHEWNACRKERKDTDVALCFCFPDLYEVGASNLGLEILYHLVNERADAVAERCFAPAADLEAQLKDRNLPLSALESGRPLKDFDCIGFTLQYELCATNILNMLHLAGVPLLQAERTGACPLVLGGGPMTANPEPLADFFDAFVLGDGEEAIGDIIEVIRQFKGKTPDRSALLRALAKIPGVYVPSLYAVSYHDDGTVRAVAPAAPEAPAEVHKRTVKLDAAFFPSKKIVPYLQTVHDRLTLEVARGCPGRCRFCQAQKYYWPWRMRPAETVLQLMREGLASTGYEEVAFSSLSCTEYRDLTRLLQEVNTAYGAQRISISLPSLRCDQFSVRVAKNLGYAKRTSLTFAPEAGTERLRHVIGKDLAECEIVDTLALAHRLGWKMVKLYFMIGLPTETEADVEGINALVRLARREAGLNFNVTVSPFVPKAQTPFQWVAMGALDVLRERMKKLERVLPATVKGHFIETTLIEGALARGDRRLSAVLLKAWQKGCRFDQWKEYFRYARWQEAFAEAGLDPAFYVYRERGADEVFPWDHLVFGMGKEAMLAEYRRALAASGEAIPERPAPVPVPVMPEPKPLTPLRPVQRLRLRFGRRGVVRFLSHLEQIEMFRRIVRRAGLPVTYTAGFSPQPRMAFGPAISVGYESASEYVEVELSRTVEAAAAQAQIARELPPGFTLESVKKVPVFFPSLDSLLNVASYEIGAPVTEEQIRQFLARPEIIIEKKKENRVERIDARPLIRELKATPSGCFLQLRFGPKKTIKPEKILQELLGMSEQDVKNVPIARTALLIEKRDGGVSEP